MDMQLGPARGRADRAGVRLFCWVSEPAHVLVAHGGAMLLSTCGGALMAVLVENGRRAGLRKRGNRG